MKKILFIAALGISAFAFESNAQCALPTLVRDSLDFIKFQPAPGTVAHIVAIQRVGDSSTRQTLGTKTDNIDIYSLGPGTYTFRIQAVCDGGGRSPVSDFYRIVVDTNRP